MAGKVTTISLYLLGLSAVASAQTLFLTTDPPGRGVSTGANTVSFSSSGHADISFCPRCLIPVLGGTFSASGTVNYTSAQTLLPVAVTLFDGSTLSGTIQINQGTFNNTNGASVMVSQYGAGNAPIIITSGTGSFAGASGIVVPASSNAISVTCASGGTLNQPCPGNFTASFTFGGTGSFTPGALPPATPIPSTLILIVSGMIFAAWLFRKKWAMR